MADIDTVKSITDNLQSVLEAQGLKFSRKTFEGIKDIPASLIPYGEIHDDDEEFEETYGQRPGYAELKFLIAVILRDRNQKDLMRQTQEWRHKVREALTVNALNVGDLSASKLISKVTTTRNEKDIEGDVSILNYYVSIRYREL